MLMNLQRLPSGSSFYDKLKTAANYGRKAQRRLKALNRTLQHYGVVDEAEADMAEALLRLDVTYCGRHKPRPADEKTKMLFEMHEFFRSLQQGNK